jgi:two-component system response regulator HydG
VRELANVLEQAHVLTTGAQAPADGLIRARDLPAEFCDLQAAVPELAEGSEVLPLETVECRAITLALRAARGNQNRAAELLRIDRRRLYRKIRHYHLESLIKARLA